LLLYYRDCSRVKGSGDNVDSLSSASSTYTLIFSTISLAHLLQRLAGWRLSDARPIHALDQSLPHKWHQQPQKHRRSPACLHPGCFEQRGVPKALAKEASSAFARSPSRAAGASNRRPFSAVRRALASIAIGGYTTSTCGGIWSTPVESFPHPHAGPHAVLQQQPTQCPAYA